MSSKTWFERALFLAWYCSIGDCTYCFMSTQKEKIADPKKAIRRKEGIYAEAAISKLCGWRIEFISGGIGCYTMDEIAEITKKVAEITGQKQWLNIGPIPKRHIEKFGDSLEGVAGAVECMNPEVRKQACPSKPLGPITRMLDTAKSMGLKTAMTIIVGLGETEDDIPRLFDYIREHEIDRVTFYALNPHKGTPFTKGPTTEYYLKWISAARNEFPELEIIVGSWVNRLSELHELMNAGANAFTKFPALRYFNSGYAKQIEEEIKKAGMEMTGTLTRHPTEQELRDFIKEEKVLNYALRLLRRMKRTPPDEVEPDDADAS